MSLIEDLEDIGMPKSEIRRTIKRAKALAKRLKLQRKILDQMARAQFKKHYRDNKNKWTSRKAKAEFGRIMDKRHAIHARLVRFEGEKTEPEWDSP